jgi:hypothetical protein
MLLRKQNTLTVERPVFVNRLKRMSHYPHRLLVITTTLSPLHVACRRVKFKLREK